MPFRFLIVLVCLLHAYIGVRLAPALGHPLAAVALVLLLVASAALMPLGVASRRVITEPRTADALAWAGLLFMGLFSSLFVLTLLRDLGLLLAHAAAPFYPGARPGPALVQASAAAVPLLALSVTAWGFANARRTARVLDVEVPLAHLPAGLHGFCIVQISDIHVGPTIKQPYVQGIVDAVNRLDADVVAITGDLVDGSVAELGAHVAPLAGLRSRHGSFFVTGNHEFYAGARAWTDELRRLGIRVLENEHVLLRHGPDELLLAGVPDYTAHHFDHSQHSDPAKALAGAPLRVPAKVLLAHQPRSAPAAAEAGFDLQLSGHTHGGQFLPWRWLVPLQQPFTSGLHRLGRMWVYTSRGTGYWGPPKRFGAPSEITRLRLVPAPP